MNRDVVISKLETKAKRKIVISDIHGNLDLYQALLHQIDYKPGVDCLILLGDLIEKRKKKSRYSSLHYASSSNGRCTLYHGQL